MPSFCNVGLVPVQNQTYLACGKHVVIFVVVVVLLFVVTEVPTFPFNNCACLFMVNTSRTDSTDSELFMVVKVVLEWGRGIVVPVRITYVHISC